MPSIRLPAKRPSPTVGCTALLVCLLLSAGSALAQSWSAQAKKLFDAGDYERTIELLEPERKEVRAAMFLAFSHLQEHHFNDTRYDEQKWKTYRDYVEAKMGVEDIDQLLYFLDQEDKPPVVKEARKLAGNAFKSVKDMRDVPRLLRFLDSRDEDAREMAIEAIERNIALKRKVVDKGGTLRDVDTDVMTSRAVIEGLLERIEEKSAYKALVKIEEPVLPYLSGRSGERIEKLRSDIEKAAAKRQKKYPDSNWASAVGKTP